MSVLSVDGHCSCRGRTSRAHAGVAAERGLLAGWSPTGSKAEHIIPLGGLTRLGAPPKPVDPPSNPDPPKPPPKPKPVDTID